MNPIEQLPPSDPFALSTAAARIQRGLSLRKAASAMGISHTHLRDIERGHKPWTPRVRAAWERVVGGAQ